MLPSKISTAQIARQTKTWELMVPVLDSGEHCPHHLYGRKLG
ncbi:MAG: hypothetical protein AAFY02_06620 [Pseudomonadota bacterium]